LDNFYQLQIVTTYLGIPFDKSLELDPMVKYMNNKVNNALYSVSNFLRNPKIPISFKKNYSQLYIISRISYLDLIKKHSKQAQSTINIGLGWIAGVSR